ncbi:MAG: hypothetical protein J4F42_06675 [Desulfurellaceae bacterium]|nr:hypothetical protein [Desulfurellaceae bacterium]
MATTKDRQDIPKGSEVWVKEWLEQIGATDIRYVGDGDGPPDFLVKYMEEEIAVEVTLLHDSDGWSRTKKHAFERALKRLIEEVSKEENAPRWHSFCEYDPREPRPPSKSDKEWKEKARKALRTRGGGREIQLLSLERIRGRGVILQLWPASNEGSFAEVSEDTGSLIVSVLSERIAAGVEEKTKKVRQGKRAKEYKQWWLVFDDEVLIAPIRVLTEEERAIIEARVRECVGRKQWSKIVLVSRFQTTPSPPKCPKWFYAPWEDHEHPPLPVSP